MAENGEKSITAPVIVLREPSGAPAFVRQMSSRVNISFKRRYGERWQEVRPGIRRISREAEILMPARERWWRAFIQSDPRRHLVDYFQAGDARGPYGYLRELGLRPSNDQPSEFFSVWRPTTLDAMRMLFEGTAVGKASAAPRCRERVRLFRPH